MVETQVSRGREEFDRWVRNWTRTRVEASAALDRAFDDPEHPTDDAERLCALLSSHDAARHEALEELFRTTREIMQVAREAAREQVALVQSVSARLARDSQSDRRGVEAAGSP